MAEKIDKAVEVERPLNETDIAMESHRQEKHALRDKLSKVDTSKIKSLEEVLEILSDVLKLVTK